MFKGFNIVRGHSVNCRGANGYVDEVAICDEIRGQLLNLLMISGYPASDCSSNENVANTILYDVVSKCNKNKDYLDIHLHLNSCVGEPKIPGCEVYIWNNENDDETIKIANNIKKEICNLGFGDRGIKRTDDLYVINKSRNKSILVEIFFCNSKLDYETYLKNGCTRIAKAIAKGITGRDYLNTSTVKKVANYSLSKYKYKIENNEIVIYE